MEELENHDSYVRHFSRGSQQGRIMSDDELKFPEWQTPLQEVLLEFDREKLPEKIRNVESLILERLQQLALGNNGHDEKDSLHDALIILRIVKRDKLGFPDWE